MVRGGRAVGPVGVDSRVGLRWGGIIDRGTAAEVPHPPRFVRNGHQHGLALDAAEALVADEVVHAVRAQWSAQRAPELVLREVGQLLWAGEEPGVERAVAGVLVK